jgi:NAD-dependent deacetylase
MVSTSAINQLVSKVRHARRVVAFTGAGISTPSGIPDFRSPQSGLWEGVDPMGVASIHAFRQSPKAFYDWVYPLARTTLAARPNAAHLALAHLEKNGRLVGTITQNIDMLHQRAGSQVVYELHGHFGEATCTHCFTVFPGVPLLEKFLEDHTVPRCPHCNGAIKPNVILFGEQLPIMTLRAAQETARHADLFLVVGSSLEVAPASDLPLLAARNGASLVIVNLEATTLDSLATIVIHDDAAEVLPQIVRQLEEEA